jgi:hypothetical protein
MKSPVAKRSIVAGGHKTSVSLEEGFWSSMKEIFPRAQRYGLRADWRDRQQPPAGQSVFGDPPVRARPLQDPRRRSGWRAQAARVVVVGAHAGGVVLP